MAGFLGIPRKRSAFYRRRNFLQSAEHIIILYMFDVYNIYFYLLQDNCVKDFNPNQRDNDGDGYGDVCDNCVYARNPKQTNTDNDKTGDACDEDDDNDGKGK